MYNNADVISKIYEDTCIAMAKLQNRRFQPPNSCLTFVSREMPSNNYLQVIYIVRN